MFRDPNGGITDTDPRIRAVQIELIRRMTPAQRFERAMELQRFAEAVSEAGVRAAFPAASEREVFLRTAARRLPREWMIRVYGWDPDSNDPPV
jgi:hypothetical protein